MLSLTKGTLPNCCPIHVSRMLSLAECVSVKLLPDPRQLHAVIHRVRPSKALPDLHYPYSVLRRVRLAKPLPDLCKSYSVLHRVYLSQSVA